MTDTPLTEPLFFDSAAAFRAWLAQHAATAPELLVGFWKVGSGRPSMSWSESVDEALCFGWIDGVRKRIDEQRYQIRFTPRRPGSIWSAVNLAKVEALIAAGRMQLAGLAVYEARDPAKQRVYAFEREQPAELSASELRQFRAAGAAWTYFEACPPGYRRVMLHWVCSAKRAQTRARRLAQLMEVCGRGERMV